MDRDRFLELAAESGLLAADALHTAVSDFLRKSQSPASPLTDAANLGDYLVACELLTPWQREMLLAGRSKEFFLGKFKFLAQLGNDGRKESFLVEDMSANRRAILSFGVEPSDAAATVFEMTVVDEAGHAAPPTAMRSICPSPTTDGSKLRIHRTHLRWFQFGLGTMFWTMLIAALAILLAREHAERERVTRLVRRFEIAREATGDADTYGQELRRVMAQWETTIGEYLDEYGRLLREREQRENEKKDKRPYHIPDALPSRKPQ
jgi:hypothetical protein